MSKASTPVTVFMAIIVVSVFPPNDTHCEPAFKVIQRQAVAEMEFRERDESDQKRMGGVGTISVKETKVALGTRFKLDCRFQSTSGGYEYYNVFFNALEPPPAILALFTEKDEYCGDLLVFEWGSRAGPCTWTYISGGGYAGRELGLTAGRVPRTKFRGPDQKRLLPPGRYKLQLIYLTRLRHPAHQLEGFSDKTDELGRSNVIDIEFVEPEGDPKM